ncbi:unnamed protein product [Symbiodinium sp. KB8]|nr:unnamed protein product [Symbiodinium sp. KB8]
MPPHSQDAFALLASSSNRRHAASWGLVWRCFSDAGTRRKLVAGTPSRAIGDDTTLHWRPTAKTPSMQNRLQDLRLFGKAAGFVLAGLLMAAARLLQNSIGTGCGHGGQKVLSKDIPPSGRFFTAVLRS